MTEEVNVEIIAEHSEDKSGSSATVTTLEYKQNSNTTNNVNVMNNKGSKLPETGGMGTTMLYTIGSILVGGATIAYVTNKRMKKEEN